MIIDCISDLHGELPPLKGGDLLICAGDCTANDKIAQWVVFFDWLKGQDYKHKVLVGGNHDGFLERCISSKEARILFEEAGEEMDPMPCEYLCDSGLEIEGLKIWGSPWTPRFYNWHFMLDRGERIRQKWALIPDDTDILVTHAPAWGILDRSYRGDNIGCEDLYDRLIELRKLKLHVFGHCHEGYGRQFAYTSMENASSPEEFMQFMFDDSKCVGGGRLSINCSIMNREYESVNKPQRVIL